MIYFKFTKRFICWECTRTNQFRIVPDSLQLVWNYFACFKDCSLRKQIYTLWNSFIADWKLFNPLSIPEFYFSLRISQLKWCRNKCIFAINDQINVQGQTCTFRFFSTLHLETYVNHLSYFCLHSDSWIALLCQGSQPTNVRIVLHFPQCVPWPSHLVFLSHLRVPASKTTKAVCLTPCFFYNKWFIL